MKNGSTSLEIAGLALVSAFIMWQHTLNVTISDKFPKNNVVQIDDLKEITSLLKKKLTAKKPIMKQILRRIV